VRKMNMNEPGQARYGNWVLDKNGSRAGSTATTRKRDEKKGKGWLKYAESLAV
jgi:hypothetical protein